MGRDDKYKILAEEDEEASWVSSKNSPVAHTYLEPLDLRNWNQDQSWYS